jgi:hypothetical protein
MTSHEFFGVMPAFFSVPGNNVDRVITSLPMGGTSSGEDLTGIKLQGVKIKR